MSAERKYSFLEVKARLEAQCAYQEQCSFDLQRKMIKWGVSPDDQEALLAHLISMNFLSEERFAEAYVSGKYRIKKWGRIKIRQGLKLKRISEYAINKGMEIIEADQYWDHLLSLTRRKWESLSSEKDSYKKKAKVYRYLASRGYETDLLKDAVEKIASE